MSVTVLYGGKRQKIAVAHPQVAVRVIVASACDHFQLKSGNFALRTTFGGARRILDGNSAFAQTGVSNNAELELVVAKRPQGSAGSRATQQQQQQQQNQTTVALAVVVAGQPTKSHAARSVPAKSTLADLVVEWASSGVIPSDAMGRSPVFRVVRDRYETGQLGSTTLAQMGFGGASVRLTLELTAAAVSTPAEEKKEEAPPAAVEETKSTPMEVDTPPMMALAPSSAPPTTAPPTMEVDTAPPMPTPPTMEVEEAVTSGEDAVEAALTTLRRQLSGRDDCARTLQKYVEAVLRDPREPKFRAIRRSNAAYVAKVASTPGGEALLFALGFQKESREEDFTPSSPFDAPSEAVAQEWLVLGEVNLNLLQGARQALIEMLSPAAVAFDPFKSSNFSLAPQPKRPEQQMTATERKVAELTTKAAAMSEGEALPPADRGLRLYEQQAQVKKQDEDYDDSGDAGLVSKAAAKAAAARRKAEDAPLTTTAMRELARLQTAMAYSTCLLKIELPRRKIVEALFNAREPLSAVYALIRQLVNGEFELYISPPPTTLADGAKTLREAGLLPAAKLHLRWVGSGGDDADYLSAAGRSLLDADKPSAAYPESRPVLPNQPQPAAAPAPAETSQKRPSAAAKTGGAGEAKKKPFGWLKL